MDIDLNVDDILRLAASLPENTLPPDPPAKSILPQSYKTGMQFAIKSKTLSTYLYVLSKGKRSGSKTQVALTNIQTGGRWCDVIFVKDINKITPDEIQPFWDLVEEGGHTLVLLPDDGFILNPKYIQM